jgi:hypothetical protein
MYRVANSSGNKARIESHFRSEKKSEAEQQRLSCSLIDNSFFHCTIARLRFLPCSLGAPMLPCLRIAQPSHDQSIYRVDASVIELRNTA